MAELENSLMLRWDNVKLSLSLRQSALPMLSVGGSHDPWQSRGLGKTLEGHDTDNAPEGALFLCLGILATRKRVYELL